jgi:cysteine desulfurase
MVKPIYLDYNGTTPHAPEVIEAMRPFLESEFGNPSSSHWYGALPRQAVETARRQVGELLGCPAQHLIFTSGGTESNNHAIKTIAGSLFARGTHIITSAIEHPAVLEVCRFMEGHGFSVTILPVDENGLVDPSDAAAAITDRTILISIMHANNEVGTIQPIAEIARLARQKGILVHTDAAQSVGKIVTQLDELGVDLLSVAGHKIYAPKGWERSISAPVSNRGFSAMVPVRRGASVRERRMSWKSWAWAKPAKSQQPTWNKTPPTCAPCATAWRRG